MSKFRVTLRREIRVTHIEVEVAKVVVEASTEWLAREAAIEAGEVDDSLWKHLTDRTTTTLTGMPSVLRVNKVTTTEDGDGSK